MVKSGYEMEAEDFSGVTIRNDGILKLEECLVESGKSSEAAPQTDEM